MTANDRGTTSHLSADTLRNKETPSRVDNHTSTQSESCTWLEGNKESERAKTVMSFQDRKSEFGSEKGRVTQNTEQTDTPRSLSK